MTLPVADDQKVKWRIPLAVVLAAIAFAVALSLYSSNFGALASLFIVVPVTTLALIAFLIRGRGKTKLACLALLTFYVLSSWQMVRRPEQVRAELRWLVNARTWKSEVLQEQPRSNDGLRCLIWDSWGMFAQDTDVYLVFSPDDSLRNYSPSNLSGLPGPVWRMQRLEKQWYSVTFFTNDGWNGCRIAA
jgi:hypothetical protein